MADVSNIDCFLSSRKLKENYTCVCINATSLCSVARVPCRYSREKGAHSFLLYFSPFSLISWKLPMLPVLVNVLVLGGVLDVIADVRVHVC